jgi:DNA-binding MarR family transcriptional regulator
MSAPELAHLLLDWSTEFVRLSMQDINRCARSNGLSLPLMNVLMHLYYQGPREVMEFAEYMQVSPAGASQMVERLVQRDLVVRIEVPGDRRVRQVHLTEHGRRVVEENLAVRQEWVHSLVGSLSGDEQAVVAHAMHLLLGGTERSRPALG